MIKDQERHARHKGDDKLGKWAAKKKKDANDQEVANVEEVADLVHVQEIAGESSTSTLALHFRANNLFIGAFQELTCIYQRAPTKRVKLFKGSIQT